MTDKIIRIVIFLSFLSLCAPGSTAADLELADDGLSAGYATLAWPSARGDFFTLQQKVEGDWITLYEGGDRATTLSGLPDGTYQVRLISDGEAASAPLAITVSHHSQARAWTFFALGAVMFLLLLVLLVVGGRKQLATSTETSSPGQ